MLVAHTNAAFIQMRFAVVHQYPQSLCPEDISAKFESAAKHQGREIHDSLYNSMMIMDQMKREGFHYPKEIEDHLMHL